MIVSKQISKRKPKNQYINNIELYNAIIDHYQDIELCLVNNRPVPRLTNYIGESILLIANNLMKSPNFCNYSYKDEMIGDAIENCIKSFYRFDPSKSMNPFAYFTQICYFAAVRRLKSEKKQKAIKSEIIKNSGIIDDVSSVTQDIDNIEYTNTYLDFLKEHVDNLSKGIDDQYKPLKKFTKAHQQKIKDKEDVLKQLEQLTIENVDDIIDDSTIEDFNNIISIDESDSDEDIFN